MSRPNTAKLENSDTENKINPSQSAVSVADIENGTSSFAGKRLHFIGAGGVGMSGLARLLIKNHAIVSGSDQEKTAVTDRLCEWGADIKIGHHENHLDPAADAVVISAAIKKENPELKLARSKGLKIYKYAQMLGRLCNFYDGVAIAGTHGKSTTSGWLTYCLKQAGCDPNFIIGADIIQLGGSSGVGETKYFIAEACEYDRSFLNLKPKVGCILNIEQDHLDYYKDEDQIVEAFRDFALGIKPEGVLIANGEDSNVAKIINRLPADIRRETFGLDRNCDFYTANIQLNEGFYAFDVFHSGTLLGAARISLPGTHNILNALAVVAMAINIGLDASQVLALLPGFTGIDRRLMLKAQVGQITILDDYAHHPTEIRASLTAIRERYEPRRIFCIFQPHQYSRTRFLLNDFSESFKLADVTIVPEIYFVRDSQAAKKEVNAQILVERIRDNGNQALFIDGFDRICDYLIENVTAGDLVVTMGAGDIWKVANEYLSRLRRNS
jgi:UDP-N-acetylmuramate--alanine ligase